RSVGLTGALEVVDNPDGTIRLEQTGEFDTLVIESDSKVFLPSVNAAFELRDDLVFRVGLYRAMSRPDPSALGAGRTFVLESGTAFDSVAEAIRSITANGNPRTKPLLSWNADLSLEWYANEDSMLGAAVYY